MYIYSQEPFESVLDNNTGDNGDVLETISVNRKCRASTIYVKYDTNKSFIPKIYRGYYDENGSLQYKSTTYDIASGSGTLMLKYDMLNDFNYITYRMELECLSDGTTVTIDEMGVLFDVIVSTLDNNHSFGTNIKTDINKVPLYFQEYQESLSYTLLVNRTNLDQILNVVEKPYYLVNVINDCIDNSSNLLIENGIRVDFPTSATKMVLVTIQNIVGE